jgi:hypothetical protein
MNKIVDGKTVFSEDLGPCVPVWKNPSRMCGCKWDLLKVRKVNTKGEWWGAGGVCWERERECFSVSGAFKTYINPWGGQTQEIPTR